MSAKSRKPKLKVTPVSGSLSQAAYRLICNKILRGQLPIGAPLSRRSLSEELGIGIIPVTEALQRLEADGLVESRPRVGTRVKIATAQDVRGHYVVREGLETQSARLFCEKASSDEREELRRMAARLDQMYESEVPTSPEEAEKHWFEIHSYHMQFHMRIAECTGCVPLCVAMEKNAILVFNWLYDTAAGHRTVPRHWHTELIEAVAGRDVEAADASMRKHVRFGMEHVLLRLEQYVSVSDSIGFARFEKKRSGGRG